MIDKKLIGRIKVRCQHDCCIVSEIGIHPYAEIGFHPVWITGKGVRDGVIPDSGAFLIMSNR